MEQTDNLLSIKEIALYLGVSRQYLYRMVKASAIPAYEVGGTWRLSLSKIEGPYNRASATSGMRPQTDYDSTPRCQAECRRRATRKCWTHLRNRQHWGGKRTPSHNRGPVSGTGRSAIPGTPIFTDSPN